MKEPAGPAPFVCRLSHKNFAHSQCLNGTDIALCRRNVVQKTCLRGKAMKSMFAALLAIAFTVALTTEAQSRGTYYIQSGAPAVITQPAVIAPATTTLSAPEVLTEPAVVAPATTTTTVIQGQPLLQQQLLMPAVIGYTAGLTMDPAAMALYRGPRFENTLTMPDASTFLRP